MSSIRRRARPRMEVAPSSGDVRRSWSFWDVLPIVNLIVVNVLMLGLLVYTFSLIWKNHGGPSRDLKNKSPVKVVPPIFIYVGDGEVSFSHEETSLYLAVDLSTARNIPVIREDVLRPEVLAGIEKMVRPVWYWFFGRNVTSKFIWTWAYVQRAPEPHQVIIHFNGLDVTRNASLVDPALWCKPWQALYTETVQLARDDEQKIPLVIQVRFNISRAERGGKEDVKACLALQRIDESVAHVAFYRLRKRLWTYKTTTPAPTEPPTSPPTTKPYDAKAYIDTASSVDFNGNFFVFKVFDEAVNYYEAEKICDALTHQNENVTFTLIERITQNPSYFGDLKSYLESESNILPDESYLIWTGAKFDLQLNGGTTLMLPNGEVRFDISILSDELCEESKNFKDVIGNWAKKKSSRYLHVVMKYNQTGSDVCLKLLDEGNSLKSQALPACQRDRRPTSKLINAVYFPKVTEKKASVSIGREFCNSPLDDGAPYPGVPLSQDMIVVYEQMGWVINKTAAEGIVWTGGYFNLTIDQSDDFKKVKPYDVLVFENRDGTRSYRDPSRLRWCAGLSYVEELNKTITELKQGGYYNASGRLVVPLKINPLQGLDKFCFEPHTDDVLWPGRTLGIVACNLQQRPSLNFNGKTFYPFESFPRTSKHIDKSNDYRRNYVNARYLECALARSKKDALTSYRLSLEQNVEIVCNDFFNGSSVECFKVEVLNDLQEFANNRYANCEFAKDQCIGHGPNVHQSWLDMLFFSGAYFDALSIEPNRTVQMRKYGSPETYDLTVLGKRWCETNMEQGVSSIVNAMVENYTYYFDSKGYYPDGPRRIHVIFNFHAEKKDGSAVCLLLKDDDLYWPGSLTLSGACSNIFPAVD